VAENLIQYIRRRKKIENRLLRLRENASRHAGTARHADLQGHTADQCCGQAPSNAQHIAPFDSVGLSYLPALSSSIEIKPRLHQGESLHIHLYQLLFPAAAFCLL
jgi:hypothetical protein